MKRLALLALLLASSSVVAAPAPLAKPQRKPSPSAPVAVRYQVVYPAQGVALPPIQAFHGFVIQQVIVPQAQAPSQPPNADPPG